MLKHIIYIVFCLASTVLLSQEVSISPELSLRNYFAYDILGDVDGRSVVVRDRGFAKEVDVFNRELELIKSEELLFEKKRVDVFNITELDTVFQVLYGYFEQDSMILRYRIYDNSVRLVDSMEFARIHKKDVRKKILCSQSLNDRYIMLMTEDEDQNLVLLIYDSVKRRMDWSSKIEVADNYDRRLDEVLVTDKGSFAMLFREKAWTSDKEELLMLLVDPRAGLQKFVKLGLGDHTGSDVLIDFDNKNNLFLIVGIYSEKKSKEAKGYFFLSERFESISSSSNIRYISFEANLYEELIQGRKKKSRVLEDIALKDILFRQDGGFLLISEIEREYSRRNPYSGYARTGYDNYSRRSWIDYYNDDIIVSSISPEGVPDWNKVLYKKQFSQDDEAIYSSFYIMKTPSRLRFIYNDEIKKNNTVSEYLMDPAGKLARNSLLSTAYQNMKLRFKDAIQISSNSMIVPSESNYDLNLVRITY